MVHEEDRTMVYGGGGGGLEPLVPCHQTTVHVKHPFFWPATISEPGQWYIWLTAIVYHWGVHLLLVREHVGFQEPQLEDLEGVDGRDVLDYVHHLWEVLLRKGGDERVKHHSLAGDVAGWEFSFCEGEPGRRLWNPESGQGQLAGVGGRAADPVHGENGANRQSPTPLLVTAILHLDVDEDV